MDSSRSSDKTGSATARWDRVNRLFHAAVLRPETDRHGFLASECGTDSTLRAEVESLLAMHRAGESVALPTLPAGSRIGDYEITGFIAAGGMGAVYRAHDTRLGRDAALKVLPAAFIADSDRRARFEREARTLASLTHPNIGTIYGFEEAGPVSALALELVDGETLAERIARGKLPVDEALRIAKQIADALEAAHQRGIIHRDLKPANIKITRDGVVKVLDFGLAKLADSAGNAQLAVTAGPTMSPTLTSVGALLGTPAYMSPEQARGETADQRSDIWAFGCVLYEMLTGQHAFQGGTVADTIAQVLASHPQLDALPKAVPAPVHTLVARCLSKDRVQRISHASVLCFLLTDSSFNAPIETWRTWTLSLLQNRTSRAFAFVALFLFAGAAGSVFRYVAPRAAPGARIRPTRFAITSSPDTSLSTISDDHHIAITPDGSAVVYVGNNRTQLFVRAVDRLDPVPLADAVSPRSPFISPDGKWIGFFGRNALQKIPTAGGSAVTLSEVDSNARGATWTEDDTIFFGTDDPSSGLFSVPATGGNAKLVTTPDAGRGDRDHVWPRSIPGTHAILFTILPLEGGIDQAKIAVLDPRNGQQRVLISGGSDAHYIPGFLVYAESGLLRAVAFDRDRLEVTGSPVPVGPEVLTTTYAAADFDISADGTLAYVPNMGSGGPARTLTWVDRQGRERPLDAPVRAYQYVRISPDGTRVALDIRDQEQDIWIWDFMRETLTRLTSDPGSDRNPVWSPDGSHVAFSSTRDGKRSLYWQSADGTGTVERLTMSTNEQDPRSFSPDGRVLLYREIAPSTSYDILMTTLVNPRNVTSLIADRFTEENAAVSPDGKWLAYESNETGTSEIYVRPFPDINSGRWQVSSGGSHPVWARDGHELFYVAMPSQIMSVPITAATTFSAGKPTLVFAGTFLRTGGPPSYDVTPDGNRFLVIKESAPTNDSSSLQRVIIAQQWTDELKQMVQKN